MCVRHRHHFHRLLQRRYLTDDRVFTHMCTLNIRVATSQFSLCYLYSGMRKKMWALLSEQPTKMILHMRWSLFLPVAGMRLIYQWYSCLMIQCVNLPSPKILLQNLQGCSDFKKFIFVVFLVTGGHFYVPLALTPECFCHCHWSYPTYNHEMLFRLSLHLVLILYIPSCCVYNIPSKK
jgi:hypothetical protein